MGGPLGAHGSCEEDMGGAEANVNLKYFKWVYLLKGILVLLVCVHVSMCLHDVCARACSLACTHTCPHAHRHVCVGVCIG